MCNEVLFFQSPFQQLNFFLYQKNKEHFGHQKLMQILSLVLSAMQN